MSLFEVYPLQPIAIQRAAGSYVWDDQGQQYLDLYGGHAVISIGHGHPHWKERIRQQMEAISFYSNSVILPLQQQLADTLVRVSGKQGYRLFLCNSGAEANENALKLASFHTGRKKIIAFTGAFHGRTSLAVCATDNPAIAAPVNQADIVFLPFNDVTALEECFRVQGGEIAAVIVEGIQGVAGIRAAETDFLQAIRLQCDAYGALYVADSVQCGYGRSGRFFSHDSAAAAADMYTMAKGMGNGFPVAGILIAGHIPARYGMLGTTFGGNPLACAAALAVLEVLEQEQLMTHAGTLGTYLLQGLQQIEGLQGVRGRGLMIGFDVPPPLKGLRQHLLEHYKVFTGEAKPDVIRLLPSLALSRTEADHFLEILKSAVADLLHKN